jgi:hypothetical protein
VTATELTVWTRPRFSLTRERAVLIACSGSTTVAIVTSQNARLPPLSNCCVNCDGGCNVGRFNRATATR